MTIRRKLGEQMSFTGGAEGVLLSPETMKAILHWAESK